MSKNQPLWMRVGTGVVITTVFVGVLGLSRPQQAAALPSFETNPAVVGGVVATGISTGVQTTIMQALNGIAWSVAKMTIQSLTRSTVNWINSGFQGSPAFVSDLNENLRYLGDAVAEEFFVGLDQVVVNNTGFSIRSPFQDQLNQKLREEFYRTTGSWGINQYYDLYKDSTDPKAFINGDFNQGGFNAFFSASQNPANNPFGAYRMANAQLWAQIDAAAQARRAEIQNGRGYLSWRGNCNQGSGPNVNLSRAEKCLFNPVRTPGALIEQSLGITATSPLRQLELADSINEIVAALVGQMITQVLGPGGLVGLSEPAQGGGPSFLDRATDPSQYNASLTSFANGIDQSLKTDIQNVTQYRDNWQRVLSAAQQAQQSCGMVQEISDTIVRATQNVGRGDAALIRLNRLQTEVANANQSNARDKNVQVTTAVNSYQSLLTDPSIPNSREIAEAQIESADLTERENSTTNTYTRMLEARTSCGVFR
jgi:hypothetical protein